MTSTPTTIVRAIELISRFGHLQAHEAADVMNQIMRGETTDAQIGAYLMALRMKGETRSEIVGGARAMREHATRITTQANGDLLDTCGTGGDKSAPSTSAPQLHLWRRALACAWPSTATAPPPASAAVPMCLQSSA